MEFTLESIKLLLYSWPTLDEQRENSSSTVINLDYIDSPISYGEFYEKYIVANVPCLVGDWLTRSWLSTSTWLQQQSTSILWDHLLFQFGKFISDSR